MPATPVRIDPDRLLALLDAKQYGTLDTVTDCLDVLDRMAQDLDRHGHAYLAEQIAYVVKQAQAVHAEQVALEDEIADKENTIEKLRDALGDAIEWIENEDGVSVKRTKLIERLDKVRKAAA